MVFKRKIYEKMMEWKSLSHGESALMIEGARRIGKSTIAEEFAAEVKAGKFDLTPVELEQLNRDGTLGKCHPIKRTP